MLLEYRNFAEVARTAEEVGQACSKVFGAVEFASAKTESLKHRGFNGDCAHDVTSVFKTLMTFKISLI
jgi:hypothetical protein